MTCKQCINNMFCVLVCLGKGRGGGDKQFHHTTQTLTMPAFDIPTGPPIAKNKLMYYVHNWKAWCTKAPKHRSFTYCMTVRKGG